MAPKTSHDLADYASIVMPDEAQEPILPAATRSAILDWLEEIWAEQQLAEVGLPPRRKALFSGPPGCGKTTLAHHLAARLGMPLAIVHSERVIDAYIGSTGRNIGGLFGAAQNEGCVLFLDEFDSLGSARMQARQGADTERNHSVNTLLRHLEAYRGLLIAATNRPDDLDTAIWRRFDLQINIGPPGASEIERILSLYLAPYTLPQAALQALALDCRGASPALLRSLCEGLKRSLVLGPLIGWPMEKQAVFDRVLAGIEPPPETTNPPLWLSGHKARGVALMPWPLIRPEPKDKEEDMPNGP